MTEEGSPGTISAGFDREEFDRASDVIDRISLAYLKNGRWHCVLRKDGMDYMGEGISRADAIAAAVYGSDEPVRAEAAAFHSARVGHQHWDFAQSPAGLGRVEDEPAKTLDNTRADDLRRNVPDVKVVGDPDAWQLICKASSEREGWMKSTKAMDLPTGMLVQVTTQQRNPDGSYAVAEALTFVPGGYVAERDDGTFFLA